MRTFTRKPFPAEPNFACPLYVYQDTALRWRSFHPSTHFHENALFLRGNLPIRTQLFKTDYDIKNKKMLPQPPFLLRSSSASSTLTVQQAKEDVSRRSSRRRVLRTVTWANKAKVRFIPGITHLSEEELQDRYFRLLDDIERIQEDILEASFLMNHGASENDELTF